ncbi:hypothetical protein C8A03DRAFT_40822 [Achaetomium macrosporum]|uniref:Lysophospholipase A n=1 Tax=Achaetomium macrosporum TaxID=79813 RepID=A0AAN7CGY0_9PEZI|nr:hypothetical protein C8A03DRAFT_40822 [Achaetomium macrosporum]
MAAFWPAVLVATASCLGSAATASIQSPKSNFNWEETKYLIAFGDSYTYVQGSAGLANFSFIGDYLPNHFGFKPEGLLTNKIVQNFTGTANGGPNWAEYLTGCGLKEGLTSPLECKIQLWDFAFAGADVAEEFTPLHHNWTVPLVKQTQQYLTWAEPVIGRSMDKTKALVAVWIGINDINDSAKYNVSFPVFYNSIIEVMFEKTVQPMYDAGYQNFLFVNLPPLDRTPGNQVSSRPLPNKTMIAWWDQTLSSHTKAFTAKNPTAKTMLFDANTFLNRVLDHPEEYGIKNTTSYCPAYNQLAVLTDPESYGCQPLEEYFWYNAGHMTSHVHEILALEVDRYLRQQSTRGRQPGLCGTR